MKKVFFLFFFLSPFLQSVEIAFFIKTLPNGEIETYEHGVPYSHVAIGVGDHWLEARPYYGVHLTQNTVEMGVMTKIFINESIPEPDEAFLENVLGKKYFLFADWDDPNVFNCTKLVAYYLGILPNPMNFNVAIWGNRFKEYLGFPGLSVGELHEELIRRNYEVRSPNKCLSYLAGQD